jgi:site-specific DNA recombinase
MSKTTNLAKPELRCAIYTRKLTEEGLDQEFNSLDAQREAGEAYIKSLKHEGWKCLPDRYDDGGFTGGNMDRPAMYRLLADINAGKIDVVVVYKVDRLSRSLLDFAKIMEKFDERNVAFVSVTQQFNTSTSMGRLVLNVLLSFAQFEREIIGERIRDKIAAQRRKGIWGGGPPVLGYDVERANGSRKLVVNPDEAVQVRAIFDLYLELGALSPVMEELEQRGWVTKIWKTKQGQVKGGLPLTKQAIYQVLRNPVYIGKVRHKRDLYDGEHVPTSHPRYLKRSSANCASTDKRAVR